MSITGSQIKDQRKTISLNRRIGSSLFRVIPIYLQPFEWLRMSFSLLNMYQPLHMIVHKFTKRYVLCLQLIHVT